MNESPHNPKETLFKYASFVGLIFVQTALLTSYKFASKEGTYKFSPNAVIATAEFLKATCSFCYVIYIEGEVKSFTTDVDKSIVGKLFLVAFLYACNNTLIFFIITLLEPATVTLFKSFSPCLTAVLLYLIFDERLNYLQLYIMAVMTCALIVTKTDICTVEFTNSNNEFALIWLFVSIMLSIVAGILNAKFVKSISISISKQNCILYGFGFFFNITSYLYLNRGGTSTTEKSFFAGFSHPLTLFIIAMNTSVGFCMTLIYKYADVILKTIASVVSTTTILIISAVFFGLEVNAHILSGVTLVLTSTVAYLMIATKIDSHVIRPLPIYYKKIIFGSVLTVIVLAFLTMPK